MSSTTPQPLNQVLARIRTYQEKLASEAKEAGATKVPEKDPAEKGNASIPSDPEATEKKQNLPARQKNDSSSEDKKLEDESTHPVSTGKNVPSTVDGDAKDEQATSPTTPLSKIAARVQKIKNNLQSAGLAKTEETKSAEAKVEDAKAAGEDKVEAVASDIDENALLKLASIIVSTEGGLEAVEPVLKKAAGIEACRNLLDSATYSYNNMLLAQQEALEHEKAAAEQEAQTYEAIGHILKSASESDLNQIEKYASVHSQALNILPEDFEKLAYMQGAEDAAAMQDAMAGGAEAGIPGGGEGPASLEELAQLLEGMVASGEIDEETAMAVLEQLAAGEADGEGGGEEAPVEEVPAEGMEVSASEYLFKSAAALADKLVNS